MLDRPINVTPYWWVSAPLAHRAERGLPRRADVVVVGSGFTGLSAALQVARAGRSVVVIDAAEIGEGASTRNGGIITDQLKPSLGELTKKFGARTAHGLLREAKESIRYLRGFIRDEGIECRLTETGRLRGALSQPQLESMCRAFEALDKAVGCNFIRVGPSELASEIGTEKYVGGVVLPELFSIDPGLYHEGLLRLAEDAGVEVHGRSRMLSYERGPDGTTVTTPRGKIVAGELVVATNGYTDAAARWLRRRVVPVGSYMIATERLPAHLIQRLFPKNRTVVDTNNLLVYYRTSPDHDRVLFGGRPNYTDVHPAIAAKRLRQYLVELFPELGSYAIEYAWGGKIAYSFDKLPHIGRAADYHYAGGCCGAGVAMSSYLGRKLGLQVLDSSEAKSAFAEIPHKTIPFYNGNPWFLPVVQGWYQGRDFLGR